MEGEENRAKDGTVGEHLQLGVKMWMLSQLRSLRRYGQLSKRRTRKDKCRLHLKKRGYPEGRDSQLCQIQQISGEKS